MQQLKQITLEDLKRWGACYWSDEGYHDELAKKCEAHLPATPLQIANCDWIPVADRVWVLGRSQVFSETDLRLLACDFAEDVLHIFEGAFPNDKRPRKAIETSRRYWHGDATLEEVDDARRVLSPAPQVDIRAARVAARAAIWTTYMCITARSALRHVAEIAMEAIGEDQGLDIARESQLKRAVAMLRAQGAQEARVYISMKRAPWY